MNALSGCSTVWRGQEAYLPIIGLRQGVDGIEIVVALDSTVSASCSSVGRCWCLDWNLFLMCFHIFNFPLSLPSGFDFTDLVVFPSLISRSWVMSTIVEAGKAGCPVEGAADVARVAGSDGSTEGTTVG